ncbi:DJ-1/PfpI family protein [Paraburkholderia humisilvae]|uniref:DJ-1/PfpI domain-containing protein n=1 Tax=Paraburkholderia humisilvae TaxID=627669 RepID=A0A6J5F6J3_9BURK|nr:DJ-1/PfpI family protein [Paraburkholderia humisilvae]CAB3774419.1 hypothetical protein LMG29542_07797 [Paraburkholderia humisilvae]
MSDKAQEASSEKQAKSVKEDTYITASLYFAVSRYSMSMVRWKCGGLPAYEVVTVSEHGGVVKSVQGVATVATYSFEAAPQFDVLMVCCGAGTRREVSNATMLSFLQNLDRGTAWTTSVCTGSALLAVAGILDGVKATTNKLAYDWVTSLNENVL